MIKPNCIVDTCDKPSRSGVKNYCKMHYHRMYRNGSLDARPWHKRTTCTVAECDKPEERFTYCAMHAARHDRNGTTDYIGWKPKYGTDHPRWIGDTAGYGTVHDRLARERGRSTNHLCVDCGQQAHEWSYDRTDPSERSSGFGPYSLDLNRYHPRCISCHRRFDRVHIDSQGQRAGVVT